MKPALETISLGKGGGHAAQAASQLFCAWFCCGSSPGCCPQAPSSQTKSLREREQFSSVPKKMGWISPVPHYTFSNTSRLLHRPPGSAPASHTSPAPLSFPEFLPKARLRFPSRCPGTGSPNRSCCQGQELLGLHKQCQKVPKKPFKWVT